MDYSNSPFHKFQGWKFWILLVATLIYSVWFLMIGPYSGLAEMAPGLPLEERLYTGQEAVTILSGLDVVGERMKYMSLAVDIPFVILWALLLEALIGFGVRQLSLTMRFWSLLFVLPMLFLVVEITENSFLAITLLTDEVWTGAIASAMTLVKMCVFTLTALAGLAMSLTGLFAWLKKKFGKNYA